LSEYLIIYEQAENGGWGAYLPDMPGVVALGATREEVASGIEEALGAYVEDLEARGIGMPVPHHAAGTVAA
jgi:predicted RNase H-like HicB family nuclease